MFQAQLSLVFMYPKTIFIYVYRWYIVFRTQNNTTPKFCDLHWTSDQSKKKPVPLVSFFVLYNPISFKFFCKFLKHRVGFKLLVKPFSIPSEQQTIAAGKYDRSRSNSFDSVKRQKRYRHRNNKTQLLSKLCSRGANQIWTGDEGVADLCLTTWLWRLIL